MCVGFPAHVWASLQYLAATLDVAGKGSPSGEFPMAVFALWQSVMHVLCRVNWIDAMHGLCMLDGTVPTKTCKVLCAKTTNLTCHGVCKVGHVSHSSGNDGVRS